MSAAAVTYQQPTWLDTLAAWVLALLWFAPLAYAVWTAFHPSEYSARFTLTAPLTLVVPSFQAADRYTAVMQITLA